MPKKSKFTKEDLLKIYERYLKKESIVNIAKEYDVNPDAIYKQLRRCGIKTLPQTVTQRKYYLNENFFDVIDTEEKAYILGLLWSDGTYGKTNNNISIELQEKDVEILNKITTILQPGKPLFFNKKKKESHQNSFRLYISSKPMCDKLLSLGMFSDKAFKIRFPNIDKKLYSHFIRGFFDGDGCISTYLLKGKYSSCSFSITSNKYILSEIQEILIDELKLNKTKLAKDSRGGNINSLVYGGRNNCTKIRDWLYKDATIFLKRKYDKFYTI